MQPRQSSRNCEQRLPELLSRRSYGIAAASNRPFRCCQPARRSCSNALDVMILVGQGRDGAKHSKDGGSCCADCTHARDGSAPYDLSDFPCHRNTSADKRHTSGTGKRAIELFGVEIRQKIRCATYVRCLIRSCPRILMCRSRSAVYQSCNGRGTCGRFVTGSFGRPKS